MRKKFITKKEFQLLKDTLNNNEYENKDKRINKPTPLEALEIIKCGLRTGIDECDEELSIIETALKALEIIKEYLCIDDTNTLRLKNGSNVNLLGITFIDQDIIDLLREVLWFM